MLKNKFKMISVKMQECKLENKNHLNTPKSIDSNKKIMDFKVIYVTLFLL